MIEQETMKQEEERRVVRVLRVIRGNLTSMASTLETVKEQVVEIRKHFWDEVTVNLETSDDVIETQQSLKQQSELLAERERRHIHTERQVKKLQKLQDSPYFGRVDFREQGDTTAEPVYLGIGSLLDENGETYLIYDWRAPVSSVYYDHDPGPAEYETPLGTIRGELELKRQFIFEQGELRYVFDTGVTIGDDLLREVLGRGADAQMKTIVATIQREQNRIIRNDRSRMLLVDGPAGSGKTSAALQRVAYLLYKHRETLTADQIVLFSPNPMFNRYVATVLPELGEENMQQTTLLAYLAHRLSDRFALEDPFSRLEYVLTAEKEPGYDARTVGIAFKSSSSFLELIRRYLTALETEGLAFRSLRLKGKTIVSGSRMAEQFYSITSTAKLAPRVAAVAEWLSAELEAAVPALRKEPWVEEELQLLGPEDFLKASRMARREGRQGRGGFNEGKREDDLLRELVVQRHIRRLTNRIQKLQFLDLAATYRRLFSEPMENRGWANGIELPVEWPAICEQTLEQLGEGGLFYEDATPFLYLQDSIEGFRINMQIRHVFVDEGQDYTPIQYELLRKLFPRCRMTVVGDLNQAVYTYSSLPDFDTLESIYGPEATETVRLTRTYRSTRPIVEFTRGLLHGGSEIVPFNRAGALPTVTRAQDQAGRIRIIAAWLEQLVNAKMQTIAIICRTAKESELAHEALAAVWQERLHLVTKETAAFETGIAILPAYLAKGVEFDAVIVYDCSATSYGKETDRKLFYTACTRAMHELHLVHIDAISPFVAAADPSTYVSMP